LKQYDQKLGHGSGYVSRERGAKIYPPNKNFVLEILMRKEINMGKGLTRQEEEVRWKVTTQGSNSCGTSSHSCFSQTMPVHDTSTNGMVRVLRVLTLLSIIAIGCSVYDKFGCNSNS